MTVTDIRKDPDTLTMTVTAEFDAPVTRVWQVWADPRQLERWWGPPTYPATVGEHDLRPGGTVTYFMTGPQGDRYHGYWRVRVVDAPHRIEFDDGFALADGTPNPDLPGSTAVVTLTATESGGTRMHILSGFPSSESMQQHVEMGMEEGIRAAVGQIDALLAA